MTSPVRHHALGPDRGAGHYSEDHRRRWDDRQHRWSPVNQQADTLEIELEDYAGTSWVRSVLATLVYLFGTGTYRFVGVAHSQDGRWPTYKIVGDTFPVTRAWLPNLPPQEAWSPGMSSSLDDLRNELADQGWIHTGHGSQPWSDHYVRPCIDMSSAD